MKLLLVEDEKKSADYIKLGFNQNGFIVDHADNGVDAVYFADEHDYDAIILDIMLPKLDGWAVLAKIRKKDKHTPILLLTARDEIDDKVRGLNIGADDYLVKPFAFSELLARVQALIRRGKQQQIEVVNVADLQIDFMQHKVTKEGIRIDLTPKEYALLVLFIKRQGQVLSRTVIAEKVWDMNFDSDTNLVDVAVKRLRDKIGDNKKRLIHTVRGIGYIFEER
ncbi:MAG: DNA-binding response regulator [Gammaproteobacteria bacterium RIFCSPHIGHO2_12_FULL_35_23]|nr:MAG: DNA-binding response regulator [Gammaproteobacteria bacterium RIFCSPHIGHO2_12_FULL_35_23]